MNKIRFRYSKTGRAKYISHLDLMSTLQRAFIRAGVKLKYTEGFNPHPYISVALPLSVGYESVCELVDVSIIDDHIPDISTISLPDGIILHEAYKATRKFNDIMWIEFYGKMHYIKYDNDLICRLKKRFAEASIRISKKTKRGFSEIDIAPHIKNVKFHNDDGIIITAKISAQNPAINAVDLINALDDSYKPDHIDIKRVGIYDSNMISFR